MSQPSYGDLAIEALRVGMVCKHQKARIAALEAANTKLKEDLRAALTRERDLRKQFVEVGRHLPVQPGRAPQNAQDGHLALPCPDCL
jgi:hypothetical protein